MTKSAAVRIKGPISIKKSLNGMVNIVFGFYLSKEKLERLGSPLDEIVLFSVHKCYVVIGRRDVIRELGNCCHAGLLI